LNHLALKIISEDKILEIDRGKEKIGVIQNVIPDREIILLGDD
jgi:hypothetical protein